MPTHTHTCIHAHTHTHMHTCTHTHTCKHAHTHTHTCKHAHTHTQSHYRYYSIGTSKDHHETPHIKVFNMLSNSKLLNKHTSQPSSNCYGQGDNGFGKQHVLGNPIQWNTLERNVEITTSLCVTLDTDSFMHWDIGNILFKALINCNNNGLTQIV